MSEGMLGPGDELGDYRVESVAGQGAMGVVYRATQRRLGRPVALKVLASALREDQSFRARFDREARAAAGLSHPNIVNVHEAGDVDGVLFIAMQWVDGGDLRDRIEASGPLARKQVATLIGQMGSALDGAHATGVLHRDVKPANILLQGTRAGEHHAYLTDFGVTRPFVELRGDGGGLTQTGYLVGTPGFLAPEQIDGADIDGRADLYALGCVLFEALTGRPPFERPTSMATLLAHTSAPRPLVSKTSPKLGTAFDEIVRKALAIDPADRYRDGASLAAAVEEAADRGTILPAIKPLPRVVSADDGERPETPSRLVVSLDDELPPIAPQKMPVVQPAPPSRTPPPAPAPAATPPSIRPWVDPTPPAPARAPAPSRAALNVIALLVAGALILAAVLFLVLGGSSDDDVPTTTEAGVVQCCPGWG